MASLTTSFLILALSLFVAMSHAAVPECDIGTFRKGMTCFPCPQGTYQDKKGATECIPCPKGFFNPFTGAPGVDICKPCKSGTFSTTFGAKFSTVCKPCPSGKRSPEGADRCLSCPAGTFLPKCPQGVTFPLVQRWSALSVLYSVDARLNRLNPNVDRLKSVPLPPAPTR